MNLLHGVGDFFSLDIGTSSMRILQLSRGADGIFVLNKYAYVPIDASLTQDTSELGKRRLGETILGAVNQAGIRTKNIAIGLPASKTYTSIVETDNLPEKELHKTFSYELEKYVPMVMADAKADYIILGPSPNNPNKAEILVSSVAKEYVENEMELVESVGFNVIAMEPESLAVARALNPVGALDARVIVDMGENSTDLVVIYQDQPRLVRSIPGGFGVFVKSVAGALNVKEDQARQFILKFGLAQDKVEGQVFKILSGPLDNYVLELTKSVRFFQTKYANVRVGGIILASYAARIPLISEYIEAKANIPTSWGNPWQFVRVSPDQQNVLGNVAMEFGVAIGLSERTND